MHIYVISIWQIGYTFLLCVLAGLSNAPQYVVKNSESLEKGCILASDVDSAILPMDACEGDGALAFARSKKDKVEVQAYDYTWIFIYKLSGKNTSVHYQNFFLT